MRRTDTVCSPGVLRRLLAIADDKPLGEEPIPAKRGRRGVHRGEWLLEANGQWRFWEYERIDVAAAERAEASHA